MSNYSFEDIEPKLLNINGQANDEVYILLEIKKLLTQIEINTRKV